MKAYLVKFVDHFRVYTNCDAIKCITDTDLSIIADKISNHCKWDEVSEEYLNPCCIITTEDLTHDEVSELTGFYPGDDPGSYCTESCYTWINQFVTDKQTFDEHEGLRTKVLYTKFGEKSCKRLSRAKDSLALYLGQPTLGGL